MSFHSEQDELSLYSDVVSQFDRNISEQLLPNSSSTNTVATRADSISLSLSCTTIRSEESVEDEDVTFIKTVKRIGRDWTVFKPIHNNTLYYKVLMEPTDINESAINYLNDFVENPQKAVVYLLQFITDLCTYQNFNISEVYETFEDVSVHQMIKKMENEPTDILLKYNRYLMKSTSKWGKQARLLVLHFICNLIIQADSWKLSQKKLFLTPVLHYINFLAKSKMLVLKHTAVVISIKIITGIFNVLNDLKIKLQYYTENTSNLVNAKGKMLKDTEIYYMQVVKLLLKIVDSNCTLDDHKLEEMKFDFIKEVGVWFELQPKIIFTESKCATHLKTLIIDELPKIRRRALKTVISIIQAISSSEHSEYLENLLTKLITLIGQRIKDVNYGVSVEAVNIFTLLLEKNYHNHITTLQRDSMCELMFCNNCPLGQASGKFFVTFLRMCDLRESSVFLTKLVYFMSHPKYANHKAVLIESLIDCTPELQQWTVMFNLLYGDEIDIDSKSTLVEIMCQSMHQTLTGLSPVLRTQPRSGTVNTYVSVQIAHLFLSNFRKLLEIFGVYPKIAVTIISLLERINYSDISMDKEKRNIVTVLKVLRDEVHNTIEYDTLKVICSMLFKYSNSEIQTIKIHTNHTMELLRDDLVINYEQCIGEYEQCNDKEKAEKLEGWLIRINHFFENFDLSAVLVWNDLLYFWEVRHGEFDSIFAKQHLRCCMHNLKWQLKILIEKANSVTENELQKLISELTGKYKDYSTLCTTLFTNVSEESLGIAVFECIADLNIDFKTTLVQQVKTRKAYEQLLSEINIMFVDKVLKLVNRYLFETQNDQLSDRQQNLKRVFEMVRLKLLPFGQLRFIFKHYYSHYDDYGSMCNSVLDVNKQSTNFVTLLIVGTITTTYEDLILNQDKLDFKSKESQELKSLLNKFYLHLMLKTHSVALFFRFIFIYAAKDKMNYHILYFLKNISNNLKEGECRKIMEYYELYFVNENTDDAVLYFSEALKTRLNQLSKQKSKTPSKPFVSSTPFTASKRK